MNTEYALAAPPEQMFLGFCYVYLPHGLRSPKNVCWEAKHVHGENSTTS